MGELEVTHAGIESNGSASRGVEDGWSEPQYTETQEEQKQQ